MVPNVEDTQIQWCDMAFRKKTQNQTNQKTPKTNPKGQKRFNFQCSDNSSTMDRDGNLPVVCQISNKLYFKEFLFAAILNSRNIFICKQKKK